MFFVITCMVTFLSQERVVAICDVENNLVRTDSIAKIILLSGRNIEKNNLVVAAGVPKN